MRPNSADSVFTTLNIDVSNVVQVPVMSTCVQIGHILFMDTNGRSSVKCFDEDCRNPECVLPDVMES